MVGSGRAWTMVSRLVLRVSATYSARRPCCSSATIAAGSTTTTPSSSRPLTTLTGTTVMPMSSPVRVARPWATPAASRTSDTRSTIESGTTTAMLPSPISASICRVAATTASSNRPSSTSTSTGCSSPARTLVGARSDGVAAIITLLASAMICAGMR